MLQPEGALLSSSKVTAFSLSLRLGTKGFHTWNACFFFFGMPVAGYILFHSRYPLLGATRTAVDLGHHLGPKSTRGPTYSVCREGLLSERIRNTRKKLAKGWSMDGLRALLITHMHTHCPLCPGHIQLLMSWLTCPLFLP